MLVPSGWKSKDGPVTVLHYLGILSELTSISKMHHRISIKGSVGPSVGDVTLFHFICEMSFFLAESSLGTHARSHARTHVAVLHVHTNSHARTSHIDDASLSGPTCS